MSSKHPRRGDDRRDKDRDDNYPRKQPTSSRQEVPAIRAPMLDEFFLDGAGINREVLQLSICRFLGSEATCRPHKHEGRDGYKIKAIRTFTPAMLQDLRERSAEFATESQSRGGGQLRYEDSQTMRRNDPPLLDAMDYEPSHSIGPSYIQGTSGMPYSTIGAPSGYPVTYSQDPSAYSYASPIHQTSPYAAPPYNPYSQGTSIPQPGYDQGRPFPSEYQYPGQRDLPQGQYYGIYGDPSRDPNYTYNQGFGDSSRGQIPGSVPNYTYPNNAAPPRIFNDPNSPYGRDPRTGNPPIDPRYMQPGGAGPSAYGDGSGRDPRDTRDPREGRDPRDPRDPRDQRDTYNRPSSDYAPRRR